MPERITHDQYHSALRDPGGERAELSRVDLAGGVALAHDITEPLPPEFDAVECFYSEPPWVDGVEVFNRRAGVDHPYHAILAGFSRLIEQGRPVVLVTGKKALRHLPAPHFDTRKAKLVSIGDAWCFTWNTRPPVGETNLEIIESLAGRFTCIGDPCCGYGLTGRICARAGVRFVLSDVDPACIGRISEGAVEW